MEVGTPLAAMALPMALIGTIIGVGGPAQGVAGVTARVRADPQTDSEKVMDMDLDRDRDRARDGDMEAGVVVPTVVDMGSEVAMATLEAAGMAADTAVRATANIVPPLIHRTKTSPSRKNICQ